MTYIRMYREEYIKANQKMEYIYILYTGKFVEYIESQEMGDRVVEITKITLANSADYYCSQKLIKSISTLKSYFFAMKSFFSFMFEKGIATNIFNTIPNYEEFTQKIIIRNELKAVECRGYLEDEVVNNILDFFNCHREDRSFMAINLFFKLTLLAPAKKGIIEQLKICDFKDEFGMVKINAIWVKIPRALKEDIKYFLGEINDVDRDKNLFQYLCDEKYNNSTFTHSFCSALKKIGIVENAERVSYPVEEVRNTGIVNLIANGANPYIVSRIAGITLNALDVLVKRFSIELSEIDDIDKNYNDEISKLKYYQQI